MNTWSVKKVRIVVGLAAFAVFALIAVGLGRSGWAVWAALPAVAYAFAFEVRPATPLAGVYRRSALAFWITAPWITVAFGPNAISAALYYVPMAIGFIVGSVVESKRDDARAVRVAGLTWEKCDGGSVVIRAASGADLKRAFLASSPSGLVRSDAQGVSVPEVELWRGVQPSAEVKGTSRLSVVAHIDEVEALANGPIEWRVPLSKFVSV